MVEPRRLSTAAPPQISTAMLRAFVAVAEHGGVARAAARLGCGKSVVSKRVAQLEAAIGSALFSRGPSALAPTAAGDAYLVHARDALAALAGGDERLRELRDELSGPLRVTAPVSWGQRVLARALPPFLLAHPGIEVELTLTDRMLDLGRERIDLALRWTVDPPAELHALPLARIGWLLAAAPAYLDTAGRPAEPAALAEHACLGYWRDAGDDAWVLTRSGRRARVRVRGRLHVDNPDAVAEATIAGLGIGLLPDYLVAEALADGRLETVLPGWRPQTRFGTRITALAPPERLRASRNRALLEHLRRTLGAER